MYIELLLSCQQFFYEPIILSDAVLHEFVRCCSVHLMLPNYYQITIYVCVCVTGAPST